MTELKRVFVISAPSGAGKTTLNRMLVKNNPQIEIAVSLTCRPMRQGETDGVDYKFVTQEEFQQHIDNGDMLEWANVHGYLYGTSKQQLNSIEAREHYSLLEIDVQGWQLARKKLKKATAIYIIPPSIKSLWSRLESRGTDALEVRWRRLQNAKAELLQANIYDHFIINDDVEKAYKELESIIIQDTSSSMSATEGVAYCKKLLEEFEQSDWIDAIQQKFK